MISGRDFFPEFSRRIVRDVDLSSNLTFRFTQWAGEISHTDVADYHQIDIA